MHCTNELNRNKSNIQFMLDNLSVILQQVFDSVYKEYYDLL